MKNYLTTSIVITLILGGAAPIIGGALLGITFPEWASSHYPFHSILEGLGAFAALVITTLIMFMRLNGHLIPAYVWLACGLVGMGVLDGFHAILHVGEPFVWTHSLATFVGGAFFALVWLPENVSRGRFADQLPVYVLGITLIFGFVLIGKPELFPLMIFDGQFTPAARGLNITGGIGFLSAAGYLAFSPAIHTTSDRTVFSTHAFLFGIAALLFEGSQLWDAPWWLWHVLRLVAYMVAVYYFFTIFFQINKQLKVSHDNLEALVQKRTKEAIRKRDSWLRAIFEYAPIEIVLKDTKGQIVAVSGNVSEELGYNEESDIGKTTIDFLPSHIAEIYMAADRKVMETGEPWQQEVIEEIDGSIRYSLNAKFPVRDDAGVLTGICSLTTDISDIKKAEIELRKAHDELECRVSERTAELQKSEQRFRDIAEVTSDWLWETDSNHRYTYISDRFFEDTNYKPEDIIGKTRIDFIGPEAVSLQPELWAAHEDDLRRHRSFQKFEYFHDTEENDRRFVSISGKPYFDRNGKFLGYHGSARGITERKRAEEDLRRAKEEAEKANRAKSEFLANMSHELRTPLNAILGFSATMKEEIFGPLNEKYIEYATDINRSGAHLLNIVNDILDLSRLENETVKLHIEKVIPKDFIGELIPIISERLRERNIEFVDQCDGHENIPVLADKTKLKQILLNLFTNAIKYNAEGGKIFLSCELVANGMTRIKIGDTGLGIPLSSQHHLFEAFNRLGYDDTNIKGTGIGLTISKHLVELMGGHIDFNSAEGQGSEFWVEIPCAPDES